MKVEGSVTIYGNGATAGCTCNLVMTLVDNDTGNEVADAFDEIRAVSGAQMAISTAYVFPEAPGSHTYTLNVNISASGGLQRQLAVAHRDDLRVRLERHRCPRWRRPVSDGKNTGTEAAGQ